MKYKIEFPSTITPEWLFSDARKEVRIKTAIAKRLGIAEGSLRQRKKFTESEQNQIREFLLSLCS